MGDIRLVDFEVSSGFERGPRKFFDFEVCTANETHKFTSVDMKEKEALVAFLQAMQVKMKYVEEVPLDLGSKDEEDDDYEDEGSDDDDDDDDYDDESESEEGKPKKKKAKLTREA